MIVSANVEMFQRITNFFKFYLVLVLLPQIVWVLSNGNGFFAVCESCGQEGNVRSFMQLFTRRNDNSCSSETVHSQAKRSSSQLDSLDGVSPCTLSQVDFKENSDGCSSINPSSSEDHDLDSALKLTQFTDNLLDVSSLCTCELEVSANRIYNDSDPHGGWYTPHNLPDLSGPCTIKRIKSSYLTQRDFELRFAYTEPVILTGASEQSAFKAHSTKYRLLKDFGHDIITVATANTHSYRKEKVSLCDYVEKMLKAQTLDNLGNETLYYFGDNNREGWDSLFFLYHLPPYHLPGMTPVLSFGMAGPGTGVPFHIHGATFAETVYGRKRWFLYPPSHTPLFHPDETTLHWVTHSYPNLLASETEIPLECTLHPGEVIYFPDKWWHATLNLDTAVFMSTFYS